MPPVSNSSPFPLPKRLSSSIELLVGALLLAGLGTLLAPLMPGAANWWVAIAFYGLISGLVLVFWPHGPLGWANRVTLGRAVLVALVAGALVNDAFIDAIWLWLGVSVIALLLDGVDGWIARRTRCHSSFGARFDMELDALLIMLLCVGLIMEEGLGLWVLLIGGMRYLFVAASLPFPWLEAPLNDSYRRKAVCVWQVVAMLLALTPLTSPLLAGLLAFSALVTLIYSFGVDIKWLYQHR